MSSNAGAECVGATGVEATGGEVTGAGAGETSRSIAVADAGSNGSNGGADSSSNEESVNPGLVATRATKAARALVLPVVDKAAEAVEDVGAVGDVAGAEELADPLDAPDVGEGAGVGELPGFIGRGGALAAGGGEAAGAGRAGGTVGIAALGVGLGAVAAADVADVAAGAGDATGRLASAGVAEAGRGVSAARAVGMPWVPELAGRVGAAPVDADPGEGAEAVVAPRVAPEAELGGGTAPVLAEGAGARAAAPACVGCGDVDLGAPDLLEVS
jgi:hypothetical protein